MGEGHSTLCRIPGSTGRAGEWQIYCNVDALHVGKLLLC